MPVYRLLYSLFGYLVFPATLLRLFWRSRQNPLISEHWQQRLGFIELSQSPRIWLHAVSVGEAIAAKPLIEALLLEYPQHKLLITNTTATGYAVTTRFFGGRVEQCYFPYDLNSIVKRFLSRSMPALFIVMETEIWPNLLHHCKQRRIPTLIANARLSERSTKKYSKVLPLITATLGKVLMIACRNEQDANNFKMLGATSKQLEVVGNIKFDVDIKVTNNSHLSLRDHLGERCKIWVAASTHRGEDEIILGCFSALKKQHDNLVLVLVPRHPERFNEVFDLCTSSFQTQRRSSNIPFYKNFEIILGDSIGEMDYWYASADIVFLGGSFSNTGGHNPLEASVYGTPVVTGPTIFNFEDVYEVLCEAKVAWLEKTPTDLIKRLNLLLNMSEVDISKLNIRTKKILENNRGVTGKLLELSHQAINSN